MATTTNLVALAVVLVSLALLFGCAQQQPSGGTGAAGGAGAPSTGGAVGAQPSGTGAVPSNSGPSADEVQQDLDSYDSGLDDSINEVGEYG
ncbi:MAG: hypothetical protein QW568_03540 [Candidatus Anstonellaceae archaeon]